MNQNEVCAKLTQHVAAKTCLGTHGCEVIYCFWKVWTRITSVWRASHSPVNIFTIQEVRVTASNLYILNPTEKSTNVSMNWLELSVQSLLNYRTDLTASHHKNRFSPSLSNYSPQVHITWFVYMPKHVSFLIPWLYCSACNTCRSVEWYHKKKQRSV